MAAGRRKLVRCPAAAGARALSGEAQLELMVIHVLAKRGHFEAGSGCSADAGIPMVVATSAVRQKSSERGNLMDKSGSDGCGES